MIGRVSSDLTLAGAGRRLRRGQWGTRPASQSGAQAETAGSACAAARCGLRRRVPSTCGRLSTSAAAQVTATRLRLGGLQLPQSTTDSDSCRSHDYERPPRFRPLAMRAGNYGNHGILH